ncbi:MAG: hypothetical protein KBS52_01090 [Clostridiales bacterium]|nr:hypothetical protein [Candidatus Equinaster intestinalis]
MFEKLYNNRKKITLILGGIFAALLILFAVFGNNTDKIINLVLAILLPVIFFGFIKLLFRILRVNASEKVMSFFKWFFLIGSSLGMLIFILKFIMAFPNGFEPTVCGTFGVIAAVAYDKKP